MKYYLQNIKGFTLIEVVMAIVIAGILSAVAMRSTVSITEAGKTEITKTEMQDIAIAIVGNKTLQNNNTRNDFGYVGDVGSMPSNLNDLMTNPGSYSTWHGPYIKNRFDQITNDFSQDAWGVTYTYSGVDITSSGSGSTLVHKIGEATSDFIINQVSGNIYDADGTPPGSVYKDSITVLLTYPNGAGGMITKGIAPDYGGYFAFDSIPIGNQDIQIVYIPTNDTLKRFVSIVPKSDVYDEYLFPSNYWYSTSVSGGGGGLIYVTGSAKAEGSGANCNDISFNIQNSTGSSISITSITPSWSLPISFYKTLTIDGNVVFNVSNPHNGTGQIVNFGSITISAGATVTITIKEFKVNATGGTNCDMNNTDFTIAFSDGSVITFNTGACI